MRRLAKLVALAALSLPLTLAAAPGTARAQEDDDWEVKRDPFDKKVIAKYKAILARNPFDGGALAKLLSMYRRYRTVELLESEYTAQLAKKPGEFATLVVLGHLRKTAGDEPGALARYEEAAKLKPDDAGLQLELGQLYRNAGKPAEARAAYDKVLAGTKAKATRMKALRALADLALSAGDIDGARAYFEQYIALDPKNVQLRVELGDALTQAGKHDEAIAAYQDAEKKVGSDPSRKIEIVARIGQAYEAKGADAEAVAEYRRAIKLAPKGYFIEVELTARIIDIYRRKQDLPTLLAYYDKEWPASKRGHFEWSTIALLHEETGDQDKAIEAYKKAVAKSPWELETQRKLIHLLTNVGREDEAIKQYEAVVKIAPSEANFQLELASRYEAKGELKKALAVLKRLESSFPTDPGVQQALADLYQRWGKEDLALAAYERLARLEPDDPAHLVVLGEQYWQKDQKDKALATWKRIANAKTAKAYAKLGDVLAEHQMQTDGLANYAKAIKIDPKDPELYKGRAAIYESLRSYGDALADWEKLLGLLGDKPQDRTARREARRHIVSLLVRWGQKEAEYRQKWVRDFRKSPPELEAGYFLVEYYERKAQSGEPKATLEKLRTLAPEDQDVISDLVKVYRTGREFDKAVALLLELEKLAPHRKREIYTQIAEIKTAALQDEEAIEWAKKAVELGNAKDPVAWERLAERYVEMQRVADAIDAYTRTLELDRRNFKAAFALADLYVADQPHKAAELYRRILKDAQDDETLVKAGREAIKIEEIDGSLGELEKVIAPLSFQMSHKPVYRRILVELYFRLVPRLVAVHRHGDAAQRKAARAELDRLGAHGLKPLLEALNDQKDTVQQKNAVYVLGHFGNPGAAAPLIRLAKTEPKAEDATKRIGTLQQSLDWDVRVDALVSAGRLGSAAVLDDVLPLASHAEVAMREAAVFTIGRTRAPRAIAPLIAALDDRRESVQVLACLGLGGIDDARATDAAIGVVADGKRHDLTRAACAWALGARKVSSAKAVAALTAALADERGEAQRLAAWALARVGDAAALPAVIRAYFTRDDEARPVLAWAIARLAGALAAPAGGDDVGDAADYPLRGATYRTFDAGGALARLPGELPDVPPAAAVLVGHEAAIAAGVEAALGEHRDRVLATLLDLDGAPDGITLGALAPAAARRDAAVARALATIGAAIADDVVAHLGDEDPKVRATALSVAAKLGAAGVDDAITRALADDAMHVRHAALRAIASVARVKGAAPAALAKAAAERLRAEDWRDRQAAARALAQLGKQADVDALIAALADDNGYVRTAAAQAVGELRAARAVDALLAATDDEAWQVRAAAAAALFAIGDAASRGRLAELAADDPRPEVRRAAGGR